ncbi:MAG: SPFH domain-containing protein [Planctomycetota bacterium]|nr:SPFH domain-containing protein [Planctomycetota bacterium]
MPDRPDHADSLPPVPDPEGVDVPVEEDAPAESEAPRRAASAEFIVRSDVGSQARLREAMDPANQSLRDALRLSFRVLQVVILVLIVLFVFSGFQTVREGQSGVMLRWGKILEVDGRRDLEPGPKFSKLPYPAGEFVLFPDRNRWVDVGNAFWPGIPPGRTFDEAVSGASVNTFLRPGEDGVLLTRDGDIAHMRVRAQYEIDDPVDFVNTVENDSVDPNALDADRLVRLALERATVHSVAGLTLTQLVDFSEEDKDALKDEAQRLLDDVGAGIRIVQIELPVDPTPALAIRKAFGDLQETRTEAERRIENARQEANKALIAAAGEKYEGILALIEQYENALALEDEPAAEDLLAQINDRLEEKRSGDVAEIIDFARAYRSTVESTLGNEARRFAGLLPAYRENPALVAWQLWSAAYENVLSREDVEIFYVPDGVAMINLQLSGYDKVRQTRRTNMLERSEQETRAAGWEGQTPYIQRGRDMDRRVRGLPGRQLDPTGQRLGRDDSSP